MFVSEKILSMTIRDRLAAGETQASIAADFGISPKQVRKIKLGQRWWKTSSEERNVMTKTRKEAGDK